MISAMSGFMTFLLIVGLLIVVLEFSRRCHGLYVGPHGRDLSADRDRDRVLHDLRARRED
jgi:hypothetical protein